MELLDRVTRVAFIGPKHCVHLMLQITVAEQVSRSGTRIAPMSALTSASYIDSEIEGLIQELRAVAKKAKQEIWRAAGEDAE